MMILKPFLLILGRRKQKLLFFKTKKNLLKIFPIGTALCVTNVIVSCSIWLVVVHGIPTVQNTR